MQETVICTRCARIMEEAGIKIKETGRHEKAVCSNCGKRRYGCRVIVEVKK